ncbi:hypothetical protein ACG5V6_21585 [Streptomyces chitinivorans]|uniref:DUF3558 domain-containing protein n=1 Tax=Streptomyces chitinivorans TaxID=1257027 RepID=A0ABW7HY06_9ACTN|nr:hypothetical protein [Streptomyces chitinivorans]MDH2412126.1 hypothetical protein [Streptomyces chitinivorans]
MKSGETPFKGYLVYRLATFVLLLAALSAGVFFYWGEGEESAKEEDFCGGLLGSASVLPLSANPQGEYEHASEDPDIPLKGGGGEGGEEVRQISRCSVWQADGDVADIEAFTAWGTGPYMSEPISPSWYTEASPIGSGLTGWTEDRRAEVWLPESCSKKFGTGDVPVQVQLEIDDSVVGRWSADEMRQRMAKVLMSYAKSLAQRADCDTRKFSLTQEVPGDSSFRPVADGSQCGISGFMAFKSDAHADGSKQRVAGNMRDNWSCSLVHESESGDFLLLPSFAVTGDERTVSRYEESHSTEYGNFRVEKMKCDERDRLAIMSYGYMDEKLSSDRDKASFDYTRENILPKDLLYEEFIGAVKSELGCSS